MTYASNLIGMIEKIEELEVKAVTVGITKDEIAAIKEIAERESINTEIEYYAIMERRLVARIEAKIHGE